MAAGLFSGFAAGRSAVLTDAGLIGSDTVLATTVHPLQVPDETPPETAHDFGLDLIVAGEEVIPCRRHPRPGRPRPTSHT